MLRGTLQEDPTAVHLRGAARVCFYRGANLQRLAQEFEDNCTIWLVRFTASLRGRESGKVVSSVAIVRRSNNVDVESGFALRI